jgi:O-succinylbenzoic acid--CoA ligase
MLFITNDGTIINTDSANPYYNKVLQFKNEWDSGQEIFEIETSGSTGIPKKIQLSRNQLIASSKLTQMAFNLNEGDTAFCCLNVEYIAGMMMLVRAFEIGMDLMVVEPKSNPFEGLEKHLFMLQKNTFYAFVPLQIENILDQANLAITLNSAKAVIIGGASVNALIQEKVQNLATPVFATYGMTETVTHIAIKRLNGGFKKDYFEVLPKVKISIDERNCLKILSVTTNNEWIFTNDLVEIIDEDKFILLGRVDNTINSGGVKIQLEKVDLIIGQNLNKIQFKNRFFCFGIANEKLGQKLVLVVENESEIEFGNNIYENLTKFEHPKQIFFVNKFIETPTGKIDKIKTVNEYVLNQIPNR